MLVRYRAVFFDAGNTLLHPYPSVERVCEEVFSRAGHNVEFDALRKAVDAGDRYYEMRYREDDSFWLSEADAAEMWVETYTLVAREVGINGDVPAERAPPDRRREEIGRASCRERV